LIARVETFIPSAIDLDPNSPLANIVVGSPYDHWRLAQEPNPIPSLSNLLNRCHRLGWWKK
jgi:hypothetical protein